MPFYEKTKHLYKYDSISFFTFTHSLSAYNYYTLWLLMIDHKGHGPKWEAFWMNVHLHAVIVCLYRGTIL